MSKMVTGAKCQLAKESMVSNVWTSDFIDIHKQEMERNSKWH
jgi:hypothetical protein